MTLAYEEIVDFIAGGSTSEEVAKFMPSKKSKARVWELLRKAKVSALDVAEREELDQYMTLEHVMRMAKAKAKLRARHE